MKALRWELKETEGADDPLFVRMLLEACEQNLPDGTLAKMGGAQ